MTAPPGSKQVLNLFEVPARQLCCAEADTILVTCNRIAHSQLLASLPDTPQSVADCFRRRHQRIMTRKQMTLSEVSVVQHLVGWCAAGLVLVLDACGWCADKLPQVSASPISSYLRPKACSSDLKVSAHRAFTATAQVFAAQRTPFLPSTFTLRASCPCRYLRLAGFHALV